MNRKSLLICLALATRLLLAPQSSVRAQEREDFDNPRPVKVQIVDADKMYKERAATIKNLLETMEKYKDDKTYSGPLCQSIYGLTSLRATEGVKAIAPYLSLIPIVEKGDPEYWNPSMWTTETFYIGASSLRHIGEPSDVRREMLQKIAWSDDEVDRTLACWVLMEIHGKDETLRILTDYSKNIGGENETRIEWTINYLRNYTISFGYPGESIGKDKFFGKGSFQQVIAKKLAAAKSATPAQTR